jgi:hypothetical protein
MIAKRFTGLTLIAILSLVSGGCMTGSGIEMGVFGSSLDSDDLGQGYGGGAKLELNPIDWVSVDARASWINFSDTDVDMIPLEVAGLVNFPLLFERIVPYVGVGAGYYMFDGSGADLADEVGYFPVAGLEIGFHRLSLLAEARYLFLETDAANGRGPLAGAAKADVDGLGVNLGLLFRF